MERRMHLEILADGSYRTMTDDEVMWYAYAAKHANYLMAFRVNWHGEWLTYPEIFQRLGLTWEEYCRRNDELLARIEAIERRQAEARKAPTADSDIIAPAGTTYTRRSYGTGRCGRCGKPESHWNPGAGEYLCTTHWDEY